MIHKCSTDLYHSPHTTNPEIIRIDVICNNPMNINKIILVAQMEDKKWISLNSKPWNF